MKISELRVQVTVQRDIKALAAILSILAPFGAVTAERLMRMVATHYGWALERKS